MFEARIPEAVLKQARELAEREKIPLEQIISLAVTQAVGIGVMRAISRCVESVQRGKSSSGR